LFPESLRERSGNGANHVVRQLLTKNGQGGPDGAFDITPSGQVSASLHLGDELLVAHLILLLRYEGEHRSARISAGRPVLRIHGRQLRARGSVY